MLDTKGPEIRLGKIKNDQFELQAGQRLLLVKEEVPGDENKVQVTPSAAIDALDIGMRLLYSTMVMSSPMSSRSGKRVSSSKLRILA